MAEEMREEMGREREESWTRHISCWKESGLTQIEYCRQNNLSKHRFHLLEMQKAQGKGTRQICVFISDTHHKEPVIK